MKKLKYKAVSEMTTVELLTIMCKTQREVVDNKEENKCNLNTNHMLELCFVEFKTRGAQSPPNPLARGAALDCKQLVQEASNLDAHYYESGESRGNNIGTLSFGNDEYIRFNEG